MYAVHGNALPPCDQGRHNDHGHTAIIPSRGFSDTFVVTAIAFLLGQPYFRFARQQAPRCH